LDFGHIVSQYLRYDAIGILDACGYRIHMHLLVECVVFDDQLDERYGVAINHRSTCNLASRRRNRQGCKLSLASIALQIDIGFYRYIAECGGTSGEAARCAYD
jgi:hypothetical protein